MAERAPGVARRGRPLRVACLLLALAGCGGRGFPSSSWDGRRGYDGSGDYGYDMNARHEAAAYEARSRAAYAVPGPPDDPWGPYIREAAARFDVPETWVRAVMQQESGGRQTGDDGSPITSGAGAMGLMQVMPGTYDLMRQRYALGPDAYSPHDNVLAGTAYLREMYARFGAPAFLAAYNAGPNRVDGFLQGTADLPDETVGYIAAIGPRVGMAATLDGPPGGRAVRPPAGPRDAAFAGGGLTGAEYAATRRY